MYVGISCKVLDGFDRILTKFVVVLQSFTKIYKYQNFMKIYPVGA